MTKETKKVDGNKTVGKFNDKSYKGQEIESMREKEKKRKRDIRKGERVRKRERVREWE